MSALVFLEHHGDVLGNGSLGVLAKAAPLRKGEPLRADDVAAAIDGLFATGRFADIVAEAEPAGDGVIVSGTNDLVSNNLIHEVDYAGMDYAAIRITGTGDLATALITALARIDVQMSNLDARQGNLDDAFVKLTRDEAALVPGGPDEARAQPVRCRRRVSPARRLGGARHGGAWPRRG